MTSTRSRSRAASAEAVRPAWPSDLGSPLRRPRELDLLHVGGRNALPVMSLGRGTCAVRPETVDDDDGRSFAARFDVLPTDELDRRQDQRFWSCSREVAALTSSSEVGRISTQSWSASALLAQYAQRPSTIGIPGPNRPSSRCRRHASSMSATSSCSSHVTPITLPCRTQTARHSPARISNGVGTMWQRCQVRQRCV